MKKVLFGCALLAIVGGSAACFSSQRHSDKPCHVTVNRIGLGQDSLEIYFAKRFKNGSEAVEVRKVPVSNLQTFCGYGIVAEETDAKQRLIDAAADSLKIVFRVEVMYQDQDQSLAEITPLKFDIAE
ncbi:MAG: hypothetical protein ACLSA1_00255 [Alphaproteobacteria bacterium]|jgi:lipoprotein